MEEYEEYEEEKAFNGEVSPVEVQEYLAGVEYPASREDLLEAADELGAPDYVIEVLESLENRIYDSPVDVAEVLGEVV